MLKVNHFDNLDNSYKAKDFLELKFMAYEIIFQKGTKKIQINCFNKTELKQTILSLFRRYERVNKTINVIGITGGEYGKNFIKSKVSI